MELIKLGYHTFLDIMLKISSKVCEESNTEEGCYSYWIFHHYTPQKGLEYTFSSSYSMKKYIGENSTSMPKYYCNGCLLGTKVACVAIEMGFLISMMVKNPEMPDNRT